MHYQKNNTNHREFDLFEVMQHRLKAQMGFDLKIIYYIQRMTEKRPWTEEEDAHLKHVYMTSGLVKWSQIARKLQEDFGVKGRNDMDLVRYTSHIDTAHPKDDWGYEEEQRMFRLHNELGNKWAIIGSKLGGKSDNCVKNHFYSVLRKALRKLNTLVNEKFKRQIKDFKPNILYKIIQVAEQKFKTISGVSKEFFVFSNELKNEFFDYSYDQSYLEMIQDQNEDIEEMNNQEGHQQNSKGQVRKVFDQEKVGKELIDKLVEFNQNYKKKNKRERRGSLQIQAPSKVHSSQNEESANLSEMLNSSEPNENVQQNSDDVINKTKNSKRTRKSSVQNFGDGLLIGPVRTRARSQGNVLQLAINSRSYTKMDIESQNNNVKVQEEEIGVQQMLQDLNVLESEYKDPAMMMLKKQSSRYSHVSESGSEKDRYFFEDSQLHMGFIPEVNILQHREPHCEQSLFYTMQ